MSEFILQSELGSFSMKDDTVDEFVGSKAEVRLRPLLDLTPYPAVIDVVVVERNASDMDAMIGCGHFGHT